MISAKVSRYAKLELQRLHAHPQFDTRLQPSYTASPLFRPSAASTLSTAIWSGPTPHRVHSFSLCSFALDNRTIRFPRNRKTSQSHNTISFLTETEPQRFARNKQKRFHHLIYLFHRIRGPHNFIGRVTNVDTMR